MGKTRDFLKKIRDTKGTFHAKMGTIKNRNGMDLTEYLMILKDAWTQLCLILMHWSIIHKRPLAKLYYSHEGP